MTGPQQSHNIIACDSIFHTCCIVECAGFSPSMLFIFHFVFHFHRGFMSTDFVSLFIDEDNNKVIDKVRINIV